VLVGLQGLAGVTYAIAVLVRAVTSVRPAGSQYGEVGYFAVLSACVLAVAVGLVTGHPWARTPAAVLQLLLLGVSWYVLGPSGQMVIGVVVAALCLAVLGLLLTRRARAWAVGAAGHGVASAADASHPDQSHPQSP